MNQSLVKEKLPDGWVKSSLFSCVEILDHKRIPINANQRKQRAGPIPYYGATGQVGWIDDYLFNEELVLLGEDGAPFLDFFKNKAYLISGKSWVNNHAHVLKGISGIVLNKYLCHYLNWFNYKEYVTGTTRLKLNQTSMKSIPVLLPPFSEQKQIVSKLESVFTRIDVVKNILETSKTSAQHAQQSVLAVAFEGKLVSQDPKDPPASALINKIGASQPTYRLRQSKTCNALSRNNFSNVSVQLPDGWTHATLEQIAMITPGQSPPSSSYNQKRSGIPFFQGKTNFGELHPTPQHWCTNPRKIAVKNDILISVRAPVGPTNLAKETCCIGRGLSGIRVTDKIHFKYILYHIRAIEKSIAASGTGTTFKAISNKQLKSIVLNIAPYNEQKRIVVKLDSIFKSIGILLTHVESTIIYLNALKSSTLKLAFDGQLVSQDVNTKPATILFKKINSKSNYLKSVNSKE